FRDAYLLTRPSIGVEEVARPHNVLLEWVATLGLGGLAWCGVGLGLVLRAGRQELGEEAPTNEREDVLLVALLAGGVTVAGALIEQAMATPQGALARVLGLGLWVGVAWGVMRTAAGAGAWTRGALAGVGGVVAAHSMIEVTPVWLNSAALLGATLGLCAGGTGASRTRGWIGGVSVGVTLLGSVLLLAGLGPLSRWEDALTRAHQRVGPVTAIRDRIARLDRETGPEGDSLESILQDLAVMVGEPVAGDPATVDSQLRRAAARGGREAFALLEKAVAARPDHPPTTEALVRLAMGLADLPGEEAGDAWRARGVEASRALAERLPSSPGVWAQLGLAHWGVWRATGERAELVASREAWARAFALDPLSLSIAVRLVDLSEALDDREGSRAWAREALRLDGLKRLDPIKQLDDRSRARMRRLSEE
ncbi:MAG: tetratricopeptide repeat protein, partial [Phycisphaerales bacterium JB059]